MNIKAAKAKGYSKIYFTFDCIGDTILLITALRYLYLQTKKKILIATLYKELTENCEHLDVLDGFCEEKIDYYCYKNLVDNGITPIFITATDFININGTYQPIWGKELMLLSVCSKVGVNSFINIAPIIFLSEKEKKDGRLFAESQIAIVSSGNQKY